jgi:hypothetical protein
MEQQMKSHVCPIACLAGRAGAVLTAVLALSVPVFALAAVRSGGQDLFGGPAIASSDDRVTNGLRIVAQPETPIADAPRVRAGSEDGSDDLVLKDWRYTDKPNPSPGH